MKIQADKSTEVDNKATMLVCVQYIFGRGCAWGCIMCSFVANQCDSCRTFQVFEWLHIKKSELIVLCQYMGGQSGSSWLNGFLVLLLGSKRSLLNVNLCTVSSIEKCWLAEKCKLNFDYFAGSIKTINHIRVHTLNSHLFLLLCEEVDAEHTCLLFYREVRCLSEARHLARVLSYKLQRFLWKVTTGSTFQWHRMGHKNIQPAQQTQYITSWEMTTVFQSTDKWLPSKPNWNYGDDEWTLGLPTFETLAETLKETEAGPFYSPADVLFFLKDLSITSQPQKTPNWEGMDPQLICE